MKRMNRTAAIAIAMTATLLSAPLTSAQPASPASDSAGASSPFDFPREWFYNGDDDAQWEKISAIVGTSVDVLPFTVRDWTGLDPAAPRVSPESLRGRIVVLEFFETSNSLSVGAVPTLNNLYSQFEGEGVEIIGVSAERGSEKLNEMIESEGIEYVTSRDTFRATAKGYGLLWHPWTVLIDRSGIVRAAGIRPEFLEQAITRINEAQPASKEFEPLTRRLDSDAIAALAESGEARLDVTPITDDWLEAGAHRLEVLRPMMNRPAPALDVSHWRNSFPRSIRDQRGKVVMLYFWVMGDPACNQMNQMLQKAIFENEEFEDVVIIGITDRVDPDELMEYCREANIEFPVCVDNFGATIKKYEANGYPDFYFIDKRGYLRIPDINIKYIPQALKMLLEESA